MKLTLPVAIALSAALLAAPQKRVTKEAPNFRKNVETALTAFDEARYTSAIDALREAMGVAIEKRREVILAAMPPAPGGWSIVPERENSNARNPFASIVATIGDVIERKYHQDDGNGQVTITITADSPLLQMFSMMIQNPAMVPDGELIEYDNNKAILKAEGTQHVLQMVLLERNLVECKGRSIDGDRVLQIMNQSVVNALTDALRK